ncbi:unnamed protein product [Mycena citricolor]|uniref:MYND-type domain-containing protein n=1 Tax=Mycena citricolor TaxID=2018698 RepID=A0AAD2Q2E6_9AGAR|nr:unnamed protein product [Mycena citricolor]
MPAQSTEMCENCLMGSRDLRRCGGCNITRYCSRECQKSHWKEHKSYCEMNKEIVRKAAGRGSEYTARLKSIGKWSDVWGAVVGTASAHALDISAHPENIDQLVLLLHVSYVPRAKPPYTHILYAHTTIPLDALRVYLSSPPWSLPAPTLKQFEQSLAPRPDMIRVLLVDKEAGWTYTTPFLVPPNMKPWPRDPNWFHTLKHMVSPPSPSLGRSGYGNRTQGGVQSNGEGRSDDPDFMSLEESLEALARILTEGTEFAQPKTQPQLGTEPPPT